MPLYWSRLSSLFVGRLYLYWRHKNVKPVCDFLFIAQWSSLSEAWRRSEGNLSQWVNLSVTSRVLFVVYSVQCSLWSHVLPVQCVQWQQYGCTAQCTHHRLLHPSEPAPVQRSVLGSLLSQGVAVTEIPYSVMITDPSVVTLWPLRWPLWCVTHWHTYPGDVVNWCQVARLCSFITSALTSGHLC